MLRSRFPALLVCIFATVHFAKAQSTSSRLNYISIARPEDQSSLLAATDVLDLFMKAGRQDDAESGAKLLALYEQYEPRAVFHTEKLYHRQRGLFEGYRSIAKDLYGYEIKPSFLGETIAMEGRVETEDGFSNEFSAELVYYGHRWRITKINFD